jgi:hypothetical protein
VNEADASTLFQSVDETTTAIDADFIKSQITPANSGCRMKLAPGADPAVSGSHKIKWRAGKDIAGGDQIDVTVKLYQGGTTAIGSGTLIASFSHTNVSAMTTYQEDLSPTEADSITNYQDLYIEIFANKP